MAQITYVRTAEHELTEVMDEGNRVIDVLVVATTILMFEEQGEEHADDPDWMPRDTADMYNSKDYFYSMPIETVPETPEYDAERLSMCTPLGVMG